ncbi:hypothetical protein QOT17_014596 [Balamuthia mandrillaris]
MAGRQPSSCSASGRCGLLAALFCLCVFAACSSADSPETDTTFHLGSTGEGEWTCSHPQSETMQCGVCIPFSLSYHTEKLFELVDLSGVDVDLSSLLGSLPSTTITIPMSDLGPIGEFIGDIDIPLDIKSILFPDTTFNFQTAVLNKHTARNLLYQYMLSEDGSFCLSITRRSCDNDFELALTHGGSPIYNLTLSAGNYLGCHSEQEFEWNLGKVSIQLTFDYGNRHISVCAQILKGLILPHNLCFLLEEVIWTYRGISFIPALDLSTPFTNEHLQFTTTTMGVVDECNRLDNFKDCESEEGCGWCSTYRHCASRSTPEGHCDGCPSWEAEDYIDPAETPAARAERKRRSSQRSRIPYLEQLAREQGKVKAEEIEVNFCGDWFHWADKNTGKVSKERFMKIAGVWLRKPGHAEKVFARLDRNNDNQISYNEYCSMSSQAAAQVSSRFGGLLEAEPNELSDGEVVGIVVSVIVGCSILSVGVAVAAYFSYRHRRTIVLQAKLHVTNSLAPIRSAEDVEELQYGNSSSTTVSTPTSPRGKNKNHNLHLELNAIGQPNAGITVEITSPRKNPLKIQVTAPETITKNDTFVASSFLPDNIGSSGRPL